jgi:hypothetical protein
MVARLILRAGDGAAPSPPHRAMRQTMAKEVSMDDQQRDYLEELQQAHV